MKELAPSQNDTMICGLCNDYDSDTCLCDKHPEWEELVETDSCDGYEELP